MIGLPCWGGALYLERTGREMSERDLEVLRAAAADEFVEHLELEDFPGMRAGLLERLGLARSRP
jgi:hypothetical protein